MVAGFVLELNMQKAMQGMFIRKDMKASIMENQFSMPDFPNRTFLLMSKY